MEKERAKLAASEKTIFVEEILVKKTKMKNKKCEKHAIHIYAGLDPMQRFIPKRNMTVITYLIQNFDYYSCDSKIKAIILEIELKCLTHARPSFIIL